jgi:hypothetical protein
MIVFVVHPEEFTDTDPRAMEVWLDLLRKKTPGERLTAARQAFARLFPRPMNMR